MVRALRLLEAEPEWLPAGRPTSEIIDVLALAMAGYVLDEAAKMDGFRALESKLRDLASAGQFNYFLDILFEGETAIYCRDGLGASTVRFEKGHHPDIWFELPTAPGAPNPCECKRIEPHDHHQREQRALAESVNKQLAQMSLPRMKVLVHLHRPAESVSSSQLLDLVEGLGRQATDEPEKWHTASTSDEAAQITVQALAQLGEMECRPVVIDDIASVGELIVRAETVYEGLAQDPVAMKSLVRVRSDVLPNRIGAFERNLHKAVAQLDLSVAERGFGTVSVRLRPPRGLGDLYEADRIVRRVLDAQQADHVGMVMLLWNEAEDDHAPKAENGLRDRTVAYHLRPHFVTNPRSNVDLSAIDSAAKRFPPTSLPLLRDLETGELVPTDLSGLADPAGAVVVPEGDDAVSLYTKLVKPYNGSMRGMFPRYLVRDQRKLVLYFMNDFQFRALEFAGDVLSAQVTVDLRAWIGELELLIWVTWRVEGFSLAIPTPGEAAKIRLSSTPVRGVYV